MVWPEQNVVLVPDKASIFNLECHGDDISWWTSTAAMVPVDLCLPTKVPGHYVILEQPPEFIKLPMVVRCTELDDLLLLSFKVHGQKIYAVSISVPNALKWKPPEKGKETEDQLAQLSLIELPKLYFESIHDLKNTDTHPNLVKDVDTLIEKMPLFSLAKVKRVKDLHSLGERDAVQNMNSAIFAMEAKLRKGAASRGRTSGDDAESVAGGKDAAAAAKKLKAALLDHAKKYYDDDTNDRFIVLKTTEGKVTEENVREAVATIDRCAV
jgi:hypothetical protein